MSVENEAEKLLLSPEKTCEVLSISMSTLWRLIHNDEHFPKAIKVTSKKTAFKYSDLVKWVDGLNVDGTPNAITGREKFNNV